MSLYETIFARRSVRKYSMTPLDTGTLENIKQFIADTKQISGQHARFEIVSSNEVKNASAPHYILAFCADNDSAYANVGYVLQNVDLYIQSLGMGSLWLGMAKPNEQEKDYCIMLAFGKTDVPHRANLSEFTRLQVSEISNADNAIAKAARLSPSAVNSQPWKLRFEDGKVVIAYLGRGLTKIILKKKLNKIDLGIITRHVQIALENEGKLVKSIEPQTVGSGFQITVHYNGIG